MKPEGEGWISTREAARILHLTMSSVNRLCSQGLLTPTRGVRRRCFFRIEAVETLARQPERTRWQEDRADVANRRHWLNGTLGEVESSGPGWEARAGLIRAKEAAAILGIHVNSLWPAARAGRLGVYQHPRRGKGDPIWFLRSEIEARLAAREAKARQIRPEPEPLRRPRYLLRERLNRHKRIEVGDLTTREKYFAEWITARQAAWLLNVTPGTAHAYRKRGRLAGRILPEYGYGNQWMFRKAEVKALMNDPRHIAGREKWAKHCSPEGRARKAAEAAAQAEREFSQQLEACWRASQRRFSFAEIMEAELA